MFPKLFGRIAELYMARYPSLTEHDLARVAVKNYLHAHLNPLAQMRDTDLDFTTASTESQRCGASPPAPSSSTIAPKSPMARPASSSARSVFWTNSATVAATVPPSSPTLSNFSAGAIAPIASRWRKGCAPLPAGETRLTRAFERADIQDPRRQLHGVEVHDCFSVSEVIAYEIIGLAEPGEGSALLHHGATMLPSVRAQILGPDAPPPPFSVPVNAGGGLMADGHPVGATGVRQVLDAYQQLTGQADQRQIKDASRFLTYNVGGSMTTTVAMVWGN